MTYDEYDQVKTEHSQEDSSFGEILTRRTERLEADSLNQSKRLRKLLSQFGFEPAAIDPVVRTYPFGIVQFAFALFTDTEKVMETLQLDKSSIDLLQTKLEILGRLGGVTNVGTLPDLPEWLDRLTRLKPTVKALQTWKFKEMMSWLENNVSMNDRYEIVEPIQILWCENHVIRQALLEKQINLEVADALEHSDVFKIFSMEELTSRHLNLLQLGGPGIPKVTKEDMKQLNELYYQKSTQYAEKKQKAAMRSRKIKDASKAAEAKVGEMLKEMKMREVSPQQVVNDLNSINDLIPISTLSSEIKDRESAEAVLTRVKSELNAANSIYQEADGDLQFGIRDEDLVARIGSGAALYGIPFGLPLSFMSKKANCPILAKPTICELMMPDSPFTTKVQELSSEQCAEQYEQVLQASGHSFALELKASGWGFYIDSGTKSSSAQREMTRNETASRATSASIIETLSVPVCTFRIPETQMMLSDEAVRDARKIRGSKQAREFLFKYYSHIPSGTVTVGGMFHKIVTVTTTTDASSAALSKKANESREFHLGSGFAWVGGATTATSSFKDFDDEGHETSTIRSCNIKTTVSAFGPPVVNSNLFVASLFADHKHWRIIDRGDSSCLIPVWEIMLRHSEKLIQEAGKEVRKAWLQIATDSRSIPAVNEAYLNATSDIKALFSDYRSDENSHRSAPLPPTNDLDLNLTPLEEYIEHLSKVAVDELRKTETEEGDHTAASAIRRIFSSVAEWSFIDRELSFRIFKARENSLENLLKECAKTCVAYEGTVHPFPKVRSAIFVNITNSKQIDFQINEQTASLFKCAEVKKLFETRDHRAVDFQENEKQTIVEIVSDERALTTELRKILASSDSTLRSKKFEDFLKWNLHHATSGFASTEKASQIMHQLEEEFGFYPNGFLTPPSTDQLKMLVSRIENGFKEQKESIDPQTEVEKSDSDQDQRLLGFNYSTFVEQFLVDRKLTSELPQDDKEFDMELRDALVHRLTLPVSPTAVQISRPDQSISVPLDFDEMFDDMFGNNGPTEITAHSGNTSKSLLPYERLIKLLNRGDDIIRHFVIEALLNRRCAIPLTVPKTVFQNMNTRLLQGLTCNIAFDTTLMRVALINLQPVSSSSLQTPLITHNILGCTTLTEYGVTSEIAEMGIGWLTDSNGKKPTPVIVIHILGEEQYSALATQIHQLCDVVLIESPNIPKAPKSSKPFPARFIFLKPDTDGFKHTLRNNEFVKIDLIFGLASSTQFRNLFQAMLRETNAERLTFDNEEKERKPVCIRGPLVSLLKSDSSGEDRSEITKEESIRNVLEQADLGKLRNQLRLQKLFKFQAEAERDASNPRNPRAKQTEAKTEAGKYRDERIRLVLSAEPENVSLLRLFETILKQKDATVRIRAYQTLERLLGEYSRHGDLAKLFDRREELRKEYRNLLSSKAVTNETIKKKNKERVAAEESYANAAIAPENLFREMACMYAVMGEIEITGEKQLDESQWNRYAEFPMLAALHLLDGFALEIIDGDCSRANLTWFNAVLSALRAAIPWRYSKLRNKEPRVFVISIFGVQKAGKSSLLNVLFGCRFGTSIGRCTRGLNMQLLPCERDNLFDFLLVIDAEGVRSPDLRESKDALLHDNRLAFNAVLLANATLVLINGDQSNDVRDILSLVKYVSDRSTGIPLDTKLFFCMRSVSTAEGASKLSEVRSVLFNMIASALQLASNENVSVDQNLMKGFEEDRDIFILGNIQMSDHPPNDVPDPQYGEKAKAMRERIHERCCLMPESNFTAKTLAEWNKHFLEIQKMIRDLEHVMVFRSADARAAREQLEEKVAVRRSDVSKKYLEVFDYIQDRFISILDGNPEKGDGLLTKAKVVVESRIKQRPELRLQRVELERENLINLLHDHVSSNVGPVISKADGDVKEILNESKYAEYREDEEMRWRNYLDEQRRVSFERVRSLVLARQYYKSKQTEYRKEIISRTMSLCNTIPFKSRENLDSVTLDAKFKHIYDGVYQSVFEECPPLHLSVKSKVEEVYKSKSVSIRPVGVHKNDQVENIGNWSRFTRYIFSGFGFTKNGDDSFEIKNLLEKVVKDVNFILRDHFMYSDAAVVLAIQTTDNAIRANNIGKLQSRQAIHFIVKEEVARLLEEKQKKWDDENNIAQKMKSETTISEWKNFFRGVVRGQNTLELLQTQLEDKLLSVIKETYTREILRDLRDRIDSNAPTTIKSARSIQFLSDLDLLEIINDEKALRNALQKPQDHYDRITKRELSKFVRQEFKDNRIWNLLRAIINSALLVAAEEASLPESYEKAGGRPERSRIFFTVLMVRLERYPLICEKLPSKEEATSMFDIDSCGERELLAMAARVASKLPETAPIIPHNILVDKFLDFLRNSTYGKDVRFRLRCEELCPVCNLRCMHLDGANHEGLHWTSHQPSGLAGLRRKGIRTINPYSCHELARLNNFLQLNTGSDSERSVSFRDLQSVYPTWKNPDWEDPHPLALQVREYIFYHKQDMLCKMFPNVVRCTSTSDPPMPPEYARDSASLREDLQKKL